MAKPRNFKANKTYAGNLITGVTNLKVWFKCRRCSSEGQTTRETANEWLDKRKPFHCAKCRKAERGEKERRKAAAGAKLETAKILDRKIVTDLSGRQRLMLTIHCQGDGCGVPFTGRVNAFRRSEALNYKLLCPDCLRHRQHRRKPSAGVVEADTQYTGSKMADATIRLLEKLTPEMRTAADKIIKAHFKACDKFGMPVENLDRVFLEAIEVAQLEAAEPAAERYSSHEPARHYEQYTTPLADAA